LEEFVGAGGRDRLPRRPPYSRRRAGRRGHSRGRREEESYRLAPTWVASGGRTACGSLGVADRWGTRCSDRHAGAGTSRADADNSRRASPNPRR